jgi:hypothetical protein
LDKLYEGEVALVFDERSPKWMRAFLMDSSVAPRKVEQELELIPFNNTRYFTIKPKQEILVSWSYSHMHGRYAKVVPDNGLPSTNDCKNKVYEEFYNRCYQEKFPRSFLNECHGLWQMAMVEHASIGPFILEYYVRRPNDSFTYKFEKQIRALMRILY